MGNTTRAPFGVKEWVNGLGVRRGLILSSPHEIRPCDPIVSLGATPFLIGSCLLPRVVNQNLIEGCLLPGIVNRNLIEGCLLLEVANQNLIEGCLLSGIANQNLIESCLLSGIANQNLIDGCLLLETVNHPTCPCLLLRPAFTPQHLYDDEERKESRHTPL